MVPMQNYLIQRTRGRDNLEDSKSEEAHYVDIRDDLKDNYDQVMVHGVQSHLDMTAETTNLI